MSVLFHGVDIWARWAPWHYQRPLKAAKTTSESHSRKVCAPLRPFCLGDEASERGKKTEADVWRRRTSPHWKAKFWGSISNAPRCATRLPIVRCWERRETPAKEKEASARRQELESRVWRWLRAEHRLKNSLETPAWRSRKETGAWWAPGATQALFFFTSFPHFSS